MNQFPYPFIPNNNLEAHLIKIEKQLQELKESIEDLKNVKKQNYLQKDDNYYML